MAPLRNSSIVVAQYWTGSLLWCNENIIVVNFALKSHGLWTWLLSKIEGNIQILSELPPLFSPDTFFSFTNVPLDITKVKENKKISCMPQQAFNYVLRNTCHLLYWYVYLWFIGLYWIGPKNVGKCLDSYMSE